MWFGLLCVSCQKIDYVSPTKVTTVHTTLDEVEALSPVSLPIDTAAEAISYAARLEWLKAGTRDMARDVNQDRIYWNVTSQRVTSNDFRWWKVEFVSPNKLPEPICIATFTDEGELVVEEKIDNLCWYKTAEK